MRRLAKMALLALLPWIALPAAAQDEDTVMLATDPAPAEVAAEATPAEAPTLQILDAAGLDLGQFLWTQRIVAVLASSPNDPAFIQQMRDIALRPDDLLARDVVVITDTDPAARSPLRQLLRARSFMLAIIEKDGSIAQRRPAPRDVREISAIIDRFPLRRQEMLERMPARR